MLILGLSALFLLALAGWKGFAVLSGHLAVQRSLREWQIGKDAEREALERQLRREQMTAAAERYAAERVLQSRKLDLEERAVAVQENRVKPVAVPVSIPSDLMRRVLRWSDPDAQDGARKILLDLYATFADASDPWAEVRSHLPPEPVDEIPQEMFTGVLQS